MQVIQLNTNKLLNPYHIKKIITESQIQPKGIKKQKQNKKNLKSGTETIVIHKQ